MLPESHRSRAGVKWTATRGSLVRARLPFDVAAQLEKLGKAGEVRRVDESASRRGRPGEEARKRNECIPYHGARSARRSLFCPNKEYTRHTGGSQALVFGVVQDEGRGCDEVESEPRRKSEPNTGESPRRARKQVELMHARDARVRVATHNTLQRSPRAVVCARLISNGFVPAKSNRSREARNRFDERKLASIVCD